MSENINFDFMPIFLKSNRENANKERAFVNTEVQDNEILKQPEFFENVYKSLHMKKSSENIETKDSDTLLQTNVQGKNLKNKISNSKEMFDISNISTEALNNNKNVIDEMFNKIKS